jgi:hypothetical protein
VCKNHLSL